MREPPPARLLEARPDGSERTGSHRRPVILAIGIALVLLVCAALVERSTARAAHLAVRGQVGFVMDAIQLDLAQAPKPLRDDDLDRVLRRHEADGARYIAVARGDGSLGPAAGHPIGAGIGSGPPLRFADRVRVVAADSPGTMPIVVEVETIAANDIFTAGKLSLVVVVVVDAITIVLGFLFSRSLRARERLAARLEVERRLAALGEMSAVLAHELKNPLTSLKGHAQLLAEQLPADGAHHKKAERVVREAVRLEKLTNDLLDLVRTGAIRPRRVDPREPVDTAIEAVAPAQIDKLYADGLADRELDPERLRVAIENVLRNAVDASGGAPVELSLAEEDGALVITVRDRGPGISKGDEEAIFQPFRSGKAKGTGLGLAIARRIVELHGGMIEASNHEDGGAVFRMSIPTSQRG